MMCTYITAVLFTQVVSTMKRADDTSLPTHVVGTTSCKLNANLVHMEGMEVEPYIGRNFGLEID